jgi:D-glycero-D-manno-heptose 1,7-bisphosphate phosphatase
LLGLTSQAAEKRDKVVKRGVFLDRDGVINASVEHCGRSIAPANLEDFHLLPGVAAAMRRLKNAGLVTVVVTNQPDVARGRISKKTVVAMHAVLQKHVPVDDIRVCWHVDADFCRCRKPKPGMILDAAAQFGIELTSSYLIGDRWRDIEAGRAAGCLTIGVVYRDQALSWPDLTADDLPEAVEYILRDAKVSREG